MKEKYDVVVLSPHLDDAVFALGQHLIDWQKQGKKIKIVNIFSGFGKKNIGLEKERQFADAAALKKLNILGDNWGLIDGGFRGDRENLTALFDGKVVSNDEKLQLVIEKKLVRLGAKMILIPMAIGSHIDHVLVRSAAERVFPKDRLKYYFDLPYLWWGNNWRALLDWRRITSLKLAGRKKITLAKLYGDEYKAVIGRSWKLLIETVATGK